MKNALNWFEIPAKNFDRAKSFYEAVLDTTLETMSMEEMGMKMAFFPADWENGVGGGIAFGPGCEPSDKGTLVYLNGGDDLTTPLSRVEAAGGKVQNNDGEILFIYRLGMWDLPKGKIEKGENTEEAALREVEEECGISKLHLLSKIKDTWHIYFHKEVFCLKKTYWFAMSYEGNEQLVPQEEEGIEEVIWIGKENLSNYLEKSYPSINELF